MGVPDLIDAWEAAWAGRDPRAFEPLCTADVHYEDPLTREPLAGPDELAAHAARLWEAFPDLRIESIGARPRDGAFAVAPCRLLGTHRGPFGSLPATERAVVVQVLVYMELDAGGRIRRARAFFDAYGAGVQLGVLPAHGSLGERAMLALRGFGLRAGR